ncbi:LysR family transcriptional regulator [Oceanobacillus neutriphilus]|uniref:LysR family transcriptional regulator n=1 Tax=Oceanobacillus neutriphilus TaxID=531815 RepID=A0ABQ2P1K9_9BACI|nr:LysR family transcriptional regulator [Oceanobacillus neutriphilus]GGP15606.1 LysR family transcriptional regulator [Oceanobacillus neutriphilus]
MPTLSQYLAFHTLIETGSFTETGLKLNLTQSSITHAMNNLEAELDIPLIIRNRNNIILTSNGKIVYEHISKILQEQQKLENTAANLKNLISGTITVGVLPSISLVLLPKVLSYFEQQYPDVTIRLMEGDYDQIENWLQHGVIDIGFIAQPAPENLVFDFIFDDELLCIMAKNHPLADEENLKLHQLKDERWIMPKQNIDRDVLRILSEHKINPNVVYELSVDQVILTMVNENLGISIVPKSILRHAPADLVQKNFSEHYTRTVGIAYKRNTSPSPAAVKFVEICKTFASHL